MEQRMILTLKRAYEHKCTAFRRACLAFALLAPAACGSVGIDSHSSGSSGGGGGGSSSSAGDEPEPADPCLAGPWALTAGSSSGVDKGMRVAVDAECNTYVVGTFFGSIDLGAGPLSESGGGYGLFAAKIDPAGHLIWGRKLGAVDPLGFATIAVDTNGHVVIGGHYTGTLDFGGGPLPSVGSYNVFVAKLDSDGGHLWGRRYGDGAVSGQTASSIAVDSTGNVIVGGWFHGELDFGAGPMQVDIGEHGFLAKLAPSGETLWVKELQSDGIARVEALAVDGTDAITFAGRFELGVDALGFSNAGDDDAYLARVDAEGSLLWARQLGGSGNQAVLGVAVDDAGDVAIGGAFTGQIDLGKELIEVEDKHLTAYAARFDSAGNVLWARAFHDPDPLAPPIGGVEQRVWGVAFGDRGQVWVAGSYRQSIKLGPEPLPGSSIWKRAFLAQLDEGGALLGQAAYGGDAGPSNEGSSAFGMMVDRAGQAHVTGVFSGTTDFGAGPVTSAGDGDLFVAKVAF
jgi:hypothetical protein